jgi:hypothetical protein
MFGNQRKIWTEGRERKLELVIRGENEKTEGENIWMNEMKNREEPREGNKVV